MKSSSENDKAASKTKRSHHQRHHSSRHRTASSDHNDKKIKSSKSSTSQAKKTNESTSSSSKVSNGKDQKERKKKEHETVKHSDVKSKWDKDDDDPVSDNDTKNEENMLNKLYKASALNSMQHLKTTIKTGDAKSKEKNQNNFIALNVDLKPNKIEVDRRSLNKSHVNSRSSSRSSSKKRSIRSKSPASSESYVSNSRSRSSSYSSKKSQSRSRSRSSTISASSKSYYSSRSSRSSSNSSSRYSHASNNRNKRNSKKLRHTSRSLSSRSVSKSRCSRSRTMSSRSSRSRRSNYSSSGSRTRSRSRSRSRTASKSSYSNHSSASTSRTASSSRSSRSNFSRSNSRSISSKSRCSSYSSKSRSSSSPRHNRSKSKGYRNSKKSYHHRHHSGHKSHSSKRSKKKRLRSRTKSSSRSVSSERRSNKNGSSNKKSTFNKNGHKPAGLNPTSALPFPSNTSFKSRHFNNNNNSLLNKNENKYSFSKNKAHLKPSLPASIAICQPTAAFSQQTLTSTMNGSSFLNRNKNPAYSSTFTNGYNSRFSFYSNTNLLNNRNNHDSTNRINNLMQSHQQQQQISPTNINKSTSKSALSVANLNNKAREELLEKRKKKAKEEKETRLSSTDVLKPETATDLNENLIDTNKTIITDNTPAIPITSYSSVIEDDDDDEDDEDDDDNEYENASQENSKNETQPSICDTNLPMKKSISIDLKKRKIDVLKVDKQEMDAKKASNQNGKKQKNDDPTTAETNSDEEESSYFNVFNAKSNIEQAATSNTNKTTNPTKPKVNNTNSMNKLKMNIKKQPIIKAGQTQKDREEIDSLFIGPKLPDSYETNPKPIKPVALNAVEFDARQQKFVLNGVKHSKEASAAAAVAAGSWKPSPVVINENTVSENTNANTDSIAQNNQQTNENPPSRPAGPKINYTKDELAKYDDLSKMSQLYAKINQVGVLNFGPNGVTEINMVELDHPQAVLMNQANMDSHLDFNLMQNQEINNYDEQKRIDLGRLIEHQQQIESNDLQNNQHQQQHQQQIDQHLKEEQMSFTLQKTNQPVGIHYSLEMNQNNLHQFIQQNNMQNFSNVQVSEQQQKLVDLQIVDKQNQKQTGSISNSEQIEKAITLQINELEGLSVPKDVTIMPSVVHSPNSTQQFISTSPKSTSPKAVIANNPPQTVQIQQSNSLVSLQNNVQTTNSINYQPSLASAPQTVMLQAAAAAQNRLQYQPIQPIQLLSLQNPNNHLIQYAAATNPTPVQQLINLQQIQLSNHQFLSSSLDGFGLNQLNAPGSFITTPSSQLTAISAHQLAALQQQNQVQHQQQQQQSQLEAIINQQNNQHHHHPQAIQMQAFAPSFQYVPASTFQPTAHPQFIQIRPNAFHTAGLAVPQQPQFIINSNPFYRILPQ